MQVEHDTGANRFLIRLPSGNAFLAYRRESEKVLEFYSTYVPPPDRGRNIGSQLVAAGMAYVRTKGLRVIPSCWYVAGWIDLHPEYRDLLAV
jgi:predicted GNAT family acetyltransferase